MPLPITAYGSSTVSQVGTFTQNSYAQFVLTFYDIDGHPYDPSSITLEILDPTDTVVDTIDGMTKLDADGEFVATYNIAVDATTGQWTLRYTFTSETTAGTETRTISEYFVVIQAGTESSQLAETQRMLMRSYLETLLRTTQRIPVKAEPAIFDSTRTIAKFTFGNWNQPAGVRVYRNNTLITTGFEVDYVRGEITFDNALERTDRIDCDYNFRWFDDQTDFPNFEASAIGRLNIYPPTTAYTYGNIPSYWLYVSMWGAAVDAIRALLMDLIHQQPQIVFGGPEMAQRMADQLESLKKNYEEDLKAALELKKYFPYTGLMKMTIASELSLPGGRCISAYSIMTYAISDKTIYTDIVQNVYTLFEQGHKISVLSDNNGETIFAPVSKIWKSGRKPLLRISDGTNSVDVSSDHIMFIDGKETPASKVKIGDILTVIENDKITNSVITSIENISEEDTYDIEVPSTQNLFVNNIKCHNSRWFRLLFSNSAG